VCKIPSLSKGILFEGCEEDSEIFEEDRDLVLFYPSEDSFDLVGYVDADYVGYQVDKIWTVIGKSLSKEFVHVIRKLLNQSCAGIPKKYLKGEYQMFFGLINKVVLRRSEKRFVASVAVSFLVEELSTIELINLPAIMLENMHKTMSVKDGKHGMGYGYLLTKVNTLKFPNKNE